MARYVNHLICIFININENLKKLGNNLKKNMINNQISAQNYRQTTIVASFISPMIEFDMYFHPVVLYENHLICIFININENLKNERENHWIN